MGVSPAAGDRDVTLGALRPCGYPGNFDCLGMRPVPGWPEHGSERVSGALRSVRGFRPDHDAGHFQTPGWISMQRFRCDLRQGPEPILPLPYTRPPVGNFFALGTGRDEKAGTAARLNRHSEIRILYVFDTGATRSYSWPATRPGGTPGTDIGPGLGHAPRSPQASRRCPGRAASRHRHLAVHRVGASSSNCIDQPVHRAGPAGPVQPASAAITGHHRQARTLSPGCIGFWVHSVHGHKRSCSDLLSCHGARFAQYVSAGQGCGVGVGFRLRAG